MAPMDEALAAEVAQHQYAFDRQVGRILVRLVPQTWKQIDLHVFSEWHPTHLELSVEIESPEDYPNEEAPVTDELKNVIELYVRMFKSYGHELSGMYIAMRQKPDGKWNYKIEYEYPDGTEL
jgi:hypothetical protein